MHCAVESAELLNIYSGNVETDEDGVAVVVLQDYVEAVNRDFRYQLTVIGQFAQAIVSEGVRNNRFKIATDKPHVAVSWHVTGVRHDAYAQAHPLIVEQDKGVLAGRMLHSDNRGAGEGSALHAIDLRPPAILDYEIR